jgi:hypothetical protein
VLDIGSTLVADRWHILKNLGDALLRVLQQHHHVLTVALAPTEDPATPSASPVALTPSTVDLSEAHAGAAPMPLTRREQEQQTRYAAKCAQHAKVQQLHAEGFSLHAIAARTGLERKTVRKYMQVPTLPPPQARGQRHNLLDPYKPYLLQRWQSGCQNACSCSKRSERKGIRASAQSYATI